MRIAKNILLSCVMMYAGLLCNQTMIAAASSSKVTGEERRKVRGCWGRVIKVFSGVVAVGLVAKGVQSSSNYNAAYEDWHSKNLPLNEEIGTRCYQFVGARHADPYSTLEIPHVYCPLPSGFYAGAALHSSLADTLKTVHRDYQFGVRRAECPDRCKVKKD